MKLFIIQIILFCSSVFAAQITTQGLADQAVTNAKIANATINLTTKVTGILPVANGGTGVATVGQNTVLAGPTSGSGAPSFRTLVSGDIPSLSGLYAVINFTNVTADNLTLMTSNHTTPQIVLDGTGLANPSGVPILSSISNPRVDANPTNSSLVLFTAQTDTSHESGSMGMFSGNNVGGSGANGSGSIEVKSGNVDATGTGISGTILIATGVAPSTGQVQITTGDASNSADSSGSINAQTGHSIDGTSGNVNLGTGIPTGNGTSGTINLSTGNLSAVAASGSSGPVDIVTGDIEDSGATGASGDVNINSGQNNGAGASGMVNIHSGAGGSSGDLNLLTGNPTNGNSGQLFFETGVITTPSSTFSTGQLIQSTGFISDAGSSGNTGPVLYSSGNNAGTGGSGEFIFETGTTVSGTSGSVNIQSGSSTAGSSGDVKINAGSTGPTSFAGEVGIGTAPQMNSGSSSDTGVIGVETGPVIDTTSTGASGSNTINTGDNFGLGGTGLLLLNTGSIQNAGSNANTGSSVFSTGNNIGSGTTGSILYQTGDATTGNSGGITFQIGASPATRGQIAFVDGTEGAAGFVWTSTDTNGHGSWQVASGAGANTFLSNLTSPTALNQDLIFAETPTSQILTQDSVSVATSNLLLATGNGTGQATGSLQLNTGQSDTQTTGQITIQPGQATDGSSATANGGAVVIVGGGTNSTAGTGGQIIIDGGQAATPTNAGAVTIQDGNSNSTIIVSPTLGVQILDDTAVLSASFETSSKFLYYSDGVTPSVLWDLSLLSDQASNTSVDWLNRTLNGPSGAQILDYSTNNQLEVISQLYFNGIIPTVSSCGTSPTVVTKSTDVAGAVNIGTGVVTSCTLTFHSTWANKPHCFVNDQTTTIATRANPSTTTVVFNGAFVTGDVLDYHCIGNK